MHLKGSKAEKSNYLISRRSDKAEISSLAIITEQVKMTDDKQQVVNYQNSQELIFQHYRMCL